MIPIDPKTLEKIIKGGIAIVATSLAAVGGWFVGKKRSYYKENIRRKKLDEKELARHEKMRRR